MIKTPGQLIQKFNTLASNIGIPENCKSIMINPLMFIAGDYTIDMVAFGEWIENTYPEYINKSIRDFLTDRDSEHLNEWLELFGISEK